LKPVKTTCTLFEFEDLAALKSILEQFSKISGLKCNFEKTSIMRIGNLEGDVDPRIQTLGFSIVEECKLLGFKFSQNQNIAELNFADLREKIRKTANFWIPFILSLPGKITISKSLILPLFNYYASILTFNKACLLELQTIIENFVVRGLNISKEKIYSSIQNGGLNLFKLEDFASALHCAWIKRVLTLQHDNWRNVLFSISANGIFYVQEYDTDNLGPVLKGICSSFIRFRNVFGTVGNNFLRIPMLNNPYFFYKQNRQCENFNLAFFEGVGRAGGQKQLEVLSWSDFINDNYTFRSREEITAATGLVFDPEKYEQLKKGYKNATKNFFKPADKIITVETFFQGIRKGSKKIRLVFNSSKLAVLNGYKNCPIKNFSHIGGEQYPLRNVINSVNSRWNKSYYGSEMRTFLFKLYHNTLGLNYRVHHINPEREETCTFCLKAKNLPAERESFQHFFWFCPSVYSILTEFLVSNVTFNVSKSNYLFGTDSQGNFREPVALLFDVMKFSCWQLKLRKILPNRHNFKTEVDYNIGIILGSNKKIRENFNECELFRRKGE
jgi:hypothetical protein